MRNTYTHRFSLNRFWEFLYYHILFYIFVGPLINIIFYKKKILMKNLHFWGKKSILPTIQYIVIITSYIIYFVQVYKLKNIYYFGEIMFF